MLGNALYQFDSDKVAKQNNMTCFPVTGLAWRSTRSDAQIDQVLLGSMCDGSLMRWSSTMNNKCEKITLNSAN
jgi:hypothetical protein